MSTNAAGLYALSSILPALATLAVGARFHVRHSRKQAFGVDDWTALAGLAGLWAVTGVIIDGTRKTLFGGHSTLDPITHALVLSWRESPNVKYSWMVPLITVATLLPIKLSVIFLYRRVFHISRFFHYYSIVLCTLLIVWGVAFFFGSLFQCGKRPDAYWAGLKAYIRYCSDTGGANVALCFSDLFLDVLILVAPLLMIWRMNFCIWRKLQILAVFALGFLSTAAAATRIYIVWQDAYDTNPGHRDLLNQNTRIVLWCLVEVSSALIACCLPVLRPLVSEGWIGGAFCKLREVITSRSGSSRQTSARELEEGMAIQSIGGTDFRHVRKPDSVYRKDSKMNSNAESVEMDAISKDFGIYITRHADEKDMDGR